LHTTYLLQGDEAMRQQLQAAVAEAVTATQERLRGIVEARDAALAAAEADVQELRSALAGRDERLAQLEQQLLGAAGAGAARGGPTEGVSAEAAAAAAGGGDAAELAAEVEGLRRELAAAHQRTHEVTQMYLAAAANTGAGGSGGGAAGGSGDGDSDSAESAQQHGGVAGSISDASQALSDSPAAAVGRRVMRRRGLGVVLGGGGGKGAAPGTPIGLMGLYKRPQIRGLFVLYFVAVHAAVSAIVMQVS
jgi:hypothetical protein